MMYQRKNCVPTPSSLYSVEIEDDNDYLLDPDQMYDTLPQPYRMINKILTHILDLVWNVVETKENALLAEARKDQPPSFDEPRMLNLHNNATALGSSVDGKYIFVGLPNGLAVLDASTQSSLYVWEQKSTEITGIKSYLIGPDYHVVIAQDDMEQVRLFLFGYDTLFFVKTINENLPEISSKTLCQKWEASSGGQYAGFVLEQTSSKETWFVVYSFPVESWKKDFDSVGAALEEKKKSEVFVEILTESNNNDTQHSEKIVQDENSDLASLEKLGIKFASPILILKVKPPPRLPLPAAPFPNIGTAINKVDTGEVLGMGLNHVLSGTHLDSMNAMFQHRHEEMIQYLPDEQTEPDISATFHFVNASRVLTSDNEQNASDTVAVAVVIWWTDSPHLNHYTLLKPGKGETATFDEVVTVDLEAKPEVVWPFSSNIIYSSVSPCTSYLAVGLANGNIILWNRQLGLHKAVLTVTNESSIKSIRFLDPCLFPYDSPQYQLYPIAAATFLLVECSDGTQQLFDTCDGSQQIPRCIAEKPGNDDDVQTLLQVIPNFPELIIYVQKNGSMYIKDVGTGVCVCKIVLPQTHQIQTPWNPVFTFGDEGKILYIKAEGTEVDDTGTVKNISGIFLFHLCNCSSLNTYRARKHEKKVLPVYTIQEQRMNALMQDRMQQQVLRKSRLQNRWSQFKSELNIIQQANKVPVNSTKISINLHGR